MYTLSFFSDIKCQFIKQVIKLKILCFLVSRSFENFYVHMYICCHFLRYNVEHNFKRKMTTNGTTNCVKYLLHQGMHFFETPMSNPTVSVRKLCSPRLKFGKHVACQTEISHTSSEDWFAELWDELHLPITDLDTFLSEIIQDLTNCFYKSESPTEIVGQIKCVKSRTFHKLLRQSQISCSPNLCCKLFTYILTIIE